MISIGIIQTKRKQRCGINMIEKIFLNVGMTYSRKKLTEKLLHLYDSEFYPSAKTAGAIGGAITQRFLKYDKYTDTYTRIKN